MSESHAPSHDNTHNPDNTASERTQSTTDNDKNYTKQDEVSSTEETNIKNDREHFPVNDQDERLAESKDPQTYDEQSENKPTERKSARDSKSVKDSEAETTSGHHSESKTPPRKPVSEYKRLRYSDGGEEASDNSKNKTSDRNTDLKSKNNSERYTESDRRGEYYPDSQSTARTYTDSETTGGQSSIVNKTKGQRKKKTTKPKESVSSPRSTKSNKSILKTEDSKKSREPFGFMASLVNENTIYRQPTRSSNESTVVSLPALNSQTEINKVYVDDTEKLANKYPKRDKDFKLEFVYDLRPKYPSWYVPEKKMSRREKKAFSNINDVYADYRKLDEREQTNSKKMEDRIKQIERIKKEEVKERRGKKLEAALEQYDQLKEVREKFEILCWYRNQTQYITPRVLEHEKLSRHVYGLPESLEERQKMIKNLRRKNKKRARPSNKYRVKSQ